MDFYEDELSKLGLEEVDYEYDFDLGEFEDGLGDLDDFLGGGNDTTGDDIAKILDEFKEEFSSDVPTVPVSVSVVLAVIYSVVILIGVFGNSVILGAILGKSSMRTARNYFIATLAMSDLMLCVVAMPLTLWDVLRYTIAEITCWVTGFLLSCQAVVLVRYFPLRNGLMQMGKCVAILPANMPQHSASAYGLHSKFWPFSLRQGKGALSHSRHPLRDGNDKLRKNSP